MRILSILMVCAVFAICSVMPIQATESRDCLPLSALIARNFCTPIDIHFVSADDTKTLEPIPDPISVGGFTGFSCRLGIWIDEISHWLSTSVSEYFSANSAKHQYNVPQLASGKVQIIDITVDRKNVVCVPVEID